MSIKVTIEHPSGAFQRILEIERITGQYADHALRDPDKTDQYTVWLSGGSPRIERGGDFSHRYGDDLLTLVAEAIDALGGRGGRELKR